MQKQFTSSTIQTICFQPHGIECVILPRNRFNNFECPNCMYFHFVFNCYNKIMVPIAYGTHMHVLQTKPLDIPYRLYDIVVMLTIGIRYCIKRKLYVDDKTNIIFHTKFWKLTYRSNSTSYAHKSARCLEFIIEKRFQNLQLLKSIRYENIGIVWMFVFYDNLMITYVNQLLSFSIFIISRILTLLGNYIYSASSLMS